MSKVEVNSRVTSAGKTQWGIGTVRYCGKVQFAEGVWVGIELEEPLGKNDGSVQGVKYFECEPLYGIFARESQVQTLTEANQHSKGNTNQQSSKTEIGARRGGGGSGGGGVLKAPKAVGVKASGGTSSSGSSTSSNPGPKTSVLKAAHSKTQKGGPTITKGKQETNIAAKTSTSTTRKVLPPSKIKTSSHFKPPSKPSHLVEPELPSLDEGAEIPSLDERVPSSESTTNLQHQQQEETEMKVPLEEEGEEKEEEEEEKVEEEEGEEKEEVEVEKVEKVEKDKSGVESEFNPFAPPEPQETVELFDQLDYEPDEFLGDLGRDLKDPLDSNAESMKELYDKIERLSRSLEEQKTEYEVELAKLKEENQTLQSDFQEEKERFLREKEIWKDSLKQDQLNSVKNTDEGDQMLETTRLELTQAKDQIASLHTQIKELEEKENVRLNQIHELENQLQATEKRETPQSQDGDIEETVENLKYELESSKLDKEIAEEKAKSLEEQLESLTEEKAALEKKLQEMTAEIESKRKKTKIVESGKEEQVADLQKQLSEATNNIESQKQENQKLKEALIKLREITVHDLTKRDNRIRELERENESLTTNLSHQTFLYNSLVKTIQTTEGEKQEEVLQKD